eukprot:g13441.t1
MDVRALKLAEEATKRANDLAAQHDAPEKKDTKQDEGMEFTARVPHPDRVASPVSKNIEIPASAVDLEGTTKTVEEMLDGAREVINDFDEAFKFASLEGVSVALDTVPVIDREADKYSFTSPPPDEVAIAHGQN